MQYTYPVPSKSVAKAKVGMPAKLLRWVLISSALVTFLLSVTIFALIVGALVIYTSGRILPGVSVGDVSLGGLTADAASAQLQSAWSQIKVRDGDRIWIVTPAQLGLSLDTAATVLAAPLTINAFDPIQNQTVAWTVPNTQWGDWLTTQNASSGAVLTLDSNRLSKYLTGQNQTYNDGRHIDVAKGVAALQKAVSAGQANTTVQVLHSPSKY